MGIINFSIRNPLIVNLLLATVVIMGVLAWRSMPQEMFPVVDLDMVRVTTVFEGAPPEEVERQVTIPIEQSLDGLADIDILSSSSLEGVSSVLVRFKAGGDVDEFLREARSAVDGLTDLPDEIENPEIRRLKTRFPVISMTLYGEAEPGYLSELAEEAERRLQQIEGVASVGLAGDREWELWVVVDPWVLAARGVPLATVVSALRDNLKDLPGGSLRSTQGDILLRGMGTTPDREALGRIVLRTGSNGGLLTLADVAHLERRQEEARSIGRFNGQPSINLTVTKTAQASTIKVAEQVRAFVAEFQSELPPGVHAGLFSDLSQFVKTRLETVMSSGVIGLTFVLLSLYLFLNFRVALVTAMGIPVSFLIAVILISYLGYTINMVSLFAFLIALGMIVDDAIIVTENVYRHMEDGKPAHEAARIGAREVVWPVVASTTTTIAAFLPMFAIGGTMGAFVKVIPIVVTATLIGSLLEAFAVLPSHSAELLKVKRPRSKTRVNWGALLERYVRTLRWSLNYRYLVAILTICVLAVSGIWAKTRAPFHLFGQVEIGQFFVNIEAPSTYSISETELLAKDIDKVVQDTISDAELDTLLTNVGVQFVDFNRVRFGSHYIQLIVDLEPAAPEGFIERFVSPVVSLRFGAEQGTRERETEEIINQLREQFRTLPGIQRLSILRPQAGPAGADIRVGVTGKDVDRLVEIAGEVSGFLKRLPGAQDVSQDLEPGKLEYQYSLNSRGRDLGLTQRDIADAVRTGFLGLEVLHVSAGEKRHPVRVIYPESVRHNDADLQRLPVTLRNGATVYLGDVANINLDRGLNTVRRRDGQRLATVSAEIDKDIVTPSEVTRLITREFSDLGARHPGYELLFLGEKRAAAKSFDGVMDALIISLAIIFFILAALFRSLLDPFVVMLAIPFGLIGVIFGHALFGYHLQFLSVVGCLALTGIIVNDSLILVDFAKRMRREGMDRLSAVIAAGRVRIRPILLTTITTFLGVSPLIFFATGQTAYLAPMAVSLGFGLLFATVLILIVLPCFYLIGDDLRRFSAGLLTGFRPAATPVSE